MAVLIKSGTGPFQPSADAWAPGPGLIGGPTPDQGGGGDFPYPSFSSTTIALMRSVADINGGSTGAGTLSDAAVADSPYGATALQLAFNGNTGTVAPAAVLATPINVQNGAIRVAFKPIWSILASGGSLTTWEVQLFSAGTPSSPGTNYHKAGSASFPNSLSTSGIINGSGRFQTVAIPSNAFVANGTGADLTAIKWARLSIRASAAASPLIALGNIDFVPNPRTKAALMFRFDDAHVSTYTVAFPLMQANAVRALGFLAPGAVASAIGVNGSGRLTDAMVAELLAAGWQLGTQGYSTEDVATLEAMSASNLAAEGAGMRAVGASFGRRRDTFDGTNFTASSKIVRDAWDRTYRRTAQGFYNGNATTTPLAYGETFPFADPLQIITLNLAQAGGSPLSTYVGYAIDQVIASKGVLVISAHNELGAPGESLDAFNYALGRLATDAAYIEPHTIRSLLAPYNGDTLVG